MSRDRSMTHYPGPDGKAQVHQTGRPAEAKPLPLVRLGQGEYAHDIEADDDASTPTERSEQ